MKNKKIIVYIMAFLIIVLGSFFIYLFSDDIKIKEDLTVELNNKVNILSFVNKPKRNKILTKNELVDTSSLGDKKITIEYLNIFKKKKELNFTIKVVDTIKPVINCEDVISIPVNTPKLEIKASDNSNENINAVIEGNYDLRKVGEYKITVKATDSSENTEIKKVTLKVEAPKYKMDGYYSVKTDEAWYSIMLRDNDYVEYEVNPCHGMGCGLFYMDGRYKVEGDKIILTLDHNTDDTFEREVDKEPTIMELTIKDENTLIFKELTFTHSDKQW